MSNDQLTILLVILIIIGVILVMLGGGTYKRHKIIKEKKEKFRDFYFNGPQDKIADAQYVVEKYITTKDKYYIANMYHEGVINERIYNYLLILNDIDNIYDSETIREAVLKNKEKLIKYSNGDIENVINDVQIMIRTRGDFQFWYNKIDNAVGKYQHPNTEAIYAFELSYYGVSYFIPRCSECDKRLVGEDFDDLTCRNCQSNLYKFTLWEKTQILFWGIGVVLVLLIAIASFFFSAAAATSDDRYR